MRNKIYIIIPAYNESETIADVVCEWCKVAEQVGTGKVVIVDDGSTDNTAVIVEGYLNQYPSLELIQKRNSGHGATVLYGYYYALEQGADYIFQTDSDNQTTADEFWDFWNLRDRYDLILGERKHREDGIQRVIVTKTLRLLLKLCFGVSLKDANVPYRLMNAGTLKKNIDLIPKEYDLTNVLIPVIYALKGIELQWIPISFRKRQGGKNSINMMKIIKIGFKASGDFMVIKKRLNTRGIKS